MLNKEIKNNKDSVSCHVVDVDKSSNINKEITLSADVDGVFSLYQNSYQASVEFWRKANEMNMFNLMFYFSKLKYRDNYNPLTKQEKNPFNDTKLNKEYFAQLKAENKLRNTHCDRTGGFIHKSKLKLVAKKIKVPFNTLRGLLPKLEKAGLIIPKGKGWRMISMTDAAKMIGVELYQLRIKATTKKELKSKLAYNTIKSIQHKAAKLLHKTYNDMTVKVSCSELAKRLGYKSAMTGCNRERQLERVAKLIIKRLTTVKVVLVDSVNNETYSYYKNPCNSLHLAL